MSNNPEQSNNREINQTRKRFSDNYTPPRNMSDLNMNIPPQYPIDPSMNQHMMYNRHQEHLQEKMYNQNKIYPHNMSLQKSVHAEDAEVCDAMAFLNKVKDEFADDITTYDNFLETLRDYKFGKIDVEEVGKIGKALFKDKQHLLEGFNDYLPQHVKYFTDSKSESAKIYGRTPVQQQFRRSMMPPPPPNMRPMLPKIGPPHMPSHMRGIIPGMIPGYMPPPNMHPVQILRPVKHIFNKPRSEEEIKKKRKANEYIQRIKNTYANQPNVYRTFVEILQKFSPESDIATVRGEVSALFWENPDLIDDFEKEFIATELRKEEDTIFRQICKDLDDKCVLDDFLRCINYFNQNFLQKRDLLVSVIPLLKCETQKEVFRQFLDTQSKTENTSNKNSGIKKIGSYKMLNNEVLNTNQDSVSREVLNTTCVSCPVFDSEDGTFVFLKRNMYEDTLFRVEDDRSEASLVLERLDYIINSFEIFLSLLQTEKNSDKIKLQKKEDFQKNYNLFVCTSKKHIESDSQFEIGDLRISPGILKEVLRSIYEDSVNEVFERLLHNPITTLPVLIKRLYAVSKENREKFRQKNKVWNEQVDRVYTRALDINGPYYKNNEKNNFSMKVLIKEVEEGYTQTFTDIDLLKEVLEILKLFIKINQTDNKKANIPNLDETVTNILDKIFTDEICVEDFTVFCVYRYIFYIYKRLEEIKNMNLTPFRSSTQAVKMNLCDEYDCEDRFSELITLIKVYVKKEVDSIEFEESVRVLTDCRGYKVYNIKKVLLKIEKGIISVLEQDFSGMRVEISFIGGVFSAQKVEEEEYVEENDLEQGEEEIYKDEEINMDDSVIEYENVHKIEDKNVKKAKMTEDVEEK